MQNELELQYSKPKVLLHQAIRFETAHSWNPGCGAEGKHNGNDGKNWPSGNPNNPVPDSAGRPGGNICKGQNSILQIK